MEQVLRFLKYTVEPAEGKSNEIFRAGFLQACLATGRLLPGRDDNFTMDAWLAGLCADTLPLTPGAAELLRPERDAFSALRLIFQDKDFRFSLRALASEAGISDWASKLIRTAAELGNEPPPPPRMPVPMPAINEHVIVPASPPPSRPASRARPASPVPPDGLLPPILGFWERPITARNPKDTLPDIGHLITALASEDTPPALLSASLRAVVGSPERIVLPLVYRALQRGELAVQPRLKPILMGEVARVMGSFSAHDSALRLVDEMLVAYEAAPPERQPSIRERTELRRFHALCCLRAGRPEQARIVYRQLMHANPGDSGLLAEYFHAIAFSDAQEAHETARVALLANMEFPHNACLGFAEFFIGANAPTEARAFLALAARRPRDMQEHLAAAANLALSLGDGELWFSLLRSFGEVCGLSLTGLRDDATNRVFGFHAGGTPRESHEELVSVIMTSFDAAATLEQAVRSVQAQRGCNLEIIIVDDASTDDTRRVITRLAAEDARVRPLFSSHNAGTYVAKNRGIAIARGDILAFHDSDDWMHPMKLHTQLAELKEGFVCTTSQWLRMRADGHVVQRRVGGYAHINPASTMFRRDLVEQIGPFDHVRVGADAEYLNRIRLRFGWNSISQMTQCLALGLHHDASLTQSGITAFDEHRYSPLRVAYTEAWLQWHIGRIERGETVALFPGGSRPFAVPQEILA